MQQRRAGLGLKQRAQRLGEWLRDFIRLLGKVVAGIKKQFGGGCLELQSEPFLHGLENDRVSEWRARHSRNPLRADPGDRRLVGCRHHHQRGLRTGQRTRHGSEMQRSGQREFGGGQSHLAQKLTGSLVSHAIDGSEQPRGHPGVIDGQTGSGVHRDRNRSGVEACIELFRMRQQCRRLANRRRLGLGCAMQTGTAGQESRAHGTVYLVLGNEGRDLRLGIERERAKRHDGPARHDGELKGIGSNFDVGGG